MPAFTHHSHTWHQCWWTTHHSGALRVDLYHSRDPGKQQKFVDMVHAMQALVPCTDCTRHMRVYLLSHPLPKPSVFSPDSKHPYFRWTVDFHNAVSERIGRPLLEFDDALAHFRDMLTDSCPNGRCNDLLTPEALGCLQDGDDDDVDWLLVSLCVVAGLWTVLLGGLVYKQVRAK
jgi:hypothetical protein